jgi:hypothetical protein
MMNQLRLENIRNGDIIRFNNDNTRDWVVIHKSNCNKEILINSKKSKDYTDYYLFGGL